MANLLIPTSLLLTKLLSQGAVAMISMEKKLLQAITTPFSLQWPENSIFSHFWPFFTFCAYSSMTPWSRLRLLTKMFSVGAVAKITMERELLRLLRPLFQSFPWKLNFGSFFSHFSPLVLAYGQSLDPVSTSMLLPRKKVYVHLGYIFICFQNSKCNNWLISLRVIFSLYEMVSVHICLPNSFLRGF